MPLYFKEFISTRNYLKPSISWRSLFICFALKSLGEPTVSFAYMPQFFPTFIRKMFLWQRKRLPTKHLFDWEVTKITIWTLIYTKIIVEITVVYLKVSQNNANFSLRPAQCVSGLYSNIFGCNNTSLLFLLTVVTHQ